LGTSPHWKTLIPRS